MESDGRLTKGMLFVNFANKGDGIPPPPPSNRWLGVHQGCNLSLTLFNVINELAIDLDQCAASGLSLLNREVKSLFYADNLTLLSPTEQGLQQQLDTVEKYCQNWALAVNMKKTNIMIFQKRPRCPENKHQFTINNHVIEHSMSYTYLGITITASGNFNMAVNALKQWFSTGGARPPLPGGRE